MVRLRERWWEGLWLFLLLMAALGVLILISGCSKRPRAAAKVAGAAAEYGARIDGVPVAELDLKEARAALAESKGTTANLQARIGELERQQNAERRAWWRAVLYGLGGLALVGAAVCVGLGIWLGRKAFFAIAAGAAATGAVLIGLGVLTPYLGYIGIGLLAVIALPSAWYALKAIRDRSKAAEEATVLVEEAKHRQLSNQDLDAARKRQEQTGTRNEIERIRRRLGLKKEK